MIEERKRKTEKWELLLTAALLLAAVLLLAAEFQNIFRYYWLPHEMRDGANIRLAQLFAGGVNPYTEGAFRNENTSLVYMYPFLNAWIAGMLSRLTGLPAALCIYLLNGLYTLAAGCIGAVLVWKHTKRCSLSVFAYLLVHSLFWRYGFCCAMPDPLALLELFLIFLVADRETCRGREWLLALLTVLTFYTKQYFVIIAAVILCYYWFQDRRLCLRYFLICAVSASASLVLVYLFLPLYLTEAVWFIKQAASSNFRYCLKQYKDMVWFYLPLFAVYALDAGLRLRRHRVEGGGVLKGMLREEKPYLFYDCFLLIGAVCLLYFGLSEGAYLTYYLQLFMPAFVVTGCAALFRLGEGKRAAAWISLTALLSLCQLYLHMDPGFLTEEEGAVWAQLRASVYGTREETAGDEGAESDTGVYVSFPFSMLPLMEGEPTLAYGQEDCLRDAALQGWEDSRLLQKLLPGCDMIFSVYREREQQARNRIGAGGYESLLVWKGELEEAVLKENYQLETEQAMPMGTQEPVLQVWKRIPGGAG